MPVCTARVRDGGESSRRWTDCGRPVLRADRCYECLHYEVTRLTTEIREHETAINRNRARLVELQTAEAL